MNEGFKHKHLSIFLQKKVLQLIKLGHSIFFVEDICGSDLLNYENKVF